MPGFHAYIDESIRGGRYLLCLVVVESEVAGTMRRRLRALVLPGQRTLHFKKESPRRRRELLAALTEMAIEVTVYECAAVLGRSQDASRDLCLARAIIDLQARQVPVSLMIESRDGLDSHDRNTILSVRRPEPPLSFEHAGPSADPLLWLPDCFAWPVGARGEWLRRVEPMLTGGVVKVGG